MARFAPPLQARRFWLYWSTHRTATVRYATQKIELCLSGSLPIT